MDSGTAVGFCVVNKPIQNVSMQWHERVPSMEKQPCHENEETSLWQIWTCPQMFVFDTKQTFVCHNVSKFTDASSMTYHNLHQQGIGHHNQTHCQCLYVLGLARPVGSMPFFIYEFLCLLFVHCPCLMLFCIWWVCHFLINFCNDQTFQFIESFSRMENSIGETLTLISSSRLSSLLFHLLGSLVMFSALWSIGRTWRVSLEEKLVLAFTPLHLMPSVSDLS